MFLRSRAIVEKVERMLGEGIAGVLVFSLLGGASALALTDADYLNVQDGKEGRIEALRNEEIRAVRTALGLRNPENRKAELYLRLAELHLEAYRADFLLEGRIHEKEIQKEPGRRFEKVRSRKDLQEGIGAAESILTLKVDLSKLDQVYYFLGYNYGELGDKKKSRDYFEKLVRQFPGSGYSEEAWRGLADDAFQRSDFRSAEKGYTAALKHARDPSLQARMLHRLSWCQYRQRRTREAVETMKRAIALARTGEGDKYLSIREEGLRDLAIYFAELGRVEEAISYFKDNAGNGGQQAGVLERLGKEYERTGQLDQARMVYEVLLRADSGGEASFRVACKMIDLDLIREDFDSAASRLRKIQIPKTRDPDTVVATVNLKRQVRSVAVKNQERFRKQNDKFEGLKYLEASDLFYSIYLERFIPNDSSSKSESNEIRMYLAEVKRERGEPGMAAELYKKVIEERDDRYSKEAARLWVGSLASELKKRTESGIKVGDAPTSIERDFVEASDLLQKSIPDSEESYETRLRAAQILAGYSSEKDAAIGRAKALSRDLPGTPQGVLGGRLWLQLDPSRKTYRELSQNRKLLETDQKQNSELYRELLETARVLQVEDITGFLGNRDFAKAARAYEGYARNARSEKEAEGAYRGALGAYAEAGDSESVIRVMKEWRLRFPKSALLEKSVKIEASELFIKGKFNDSAELFLGMGKLVRDRGSFLTSAALFAGGLQYQKAAQVLRLAIPLALGAEERAGIFKKIALNASEMRDESGTLLGWKECAEIDSSLKAECLSEVGNIQLSHQDWESARSRFESAIRIKRGASSRSPYIAYAQFRIAQILERSMKPVTLDFPEDRLLKAFEARIQMLKPVTEAYSRAIELGGPWGIAATERLGDLSLSVSQDVEKVLRDPRATPPLKQALLPVADRLAKQSLSHSRTAYEQAMRKEVLSAALPVIHDRLVDSGAPGLMRAQGARAGIKLIGMNPDGGAEGRGDALKKVRARLLQSMEDALAWIDYGNLLWGSGKPGLAKIAYQRSLVLRTRAADAQNNLAVVEINDLGLENWFAANDALALWKKALVWEPGNSAALFNVGHLFNYYRLFKSARPYFERVLRKVQIGEVFDELAVSSQGIGEWEQSAAYRKKAEEAGLPTDRFTARFLEAGGASGPECASLVLKFPGVADLKGFEKSSFTRLKQRCP